MLIKIFLISKFEVYMIYITPHIKIDKLNFVVRITFISRIVSIISYKAILRYQKNFRIQ